MSTHVAARRANSSRPCLDGARKQPLAWTSLIPRAVRVASGRGTLENVYLDGHPTDNGTVRASYQPTGVSNDADNNIVHSAVGHALGPFMPWAVVALCVGGATFRWCKWREAWR